MNLFKCINIVESHLGTHTISFFLDFWLPMGGVASLEVVDQGSADIANCTSGEKIIAGIEPLLIFEVNVFWINDQIASDLNLSL